MESKGTTGWKNGSVIKIEMPIDLHQPASQLIAAIAGSGWPATTSKHRLQRVGCSRKDPTRSEKFQHLSHLEPSARDTPIQTLLPRMRHSPVYGMFSTSSFSMDRWTSACIWWFYNRSLSQYLNCCDSMKAIYGSTHWLSTSGKEEDSTMNHCT